jgi:hypothetical protein
MMTRSIIRVGDGRGFLVWSRRWEEPIVLTAAHCLPRLPPPMPMSYTAERTYERLLGGLDVAAEVSAECLFVDPVADVAVLCAPDSQALSEERERFETFVSSRTCLPIAHAALPSAVSMLSLQNAWIRCQAPANVPGARSISIAGPDEATAPGTSGSPILDVRGHAIALVSCGEVANPLLAECLPAWLLRDVLQEAEAVQ